MQKHMNPINSIEEAQEAIEAFNGRAEDFELPISDELQDPSGMNMAIIVDSILARGWEPNGFVQKAGYRVYIYKEME